jgi:Protein of unknown function (DUF3311)
VSRNTAWQLLLVVPFVATLWVPFYNRLEPRVWGIPYFYVYQFTWIGISVVLTAVVYFATKSDSGEKKR